LTDTHIELRARENPDREAIDPEGREGLIGCGAVLLYLKTALKHFGCLGRVDLFPALDQRTLVARIHGGFSGARDETEKRLFAAMTRNNESVSSESEFPASEPALNALLPAGTGERGWLEFVQSEMSRQRVAEIALAGKPAQMKTDHAPSRSRTGMTGWESPRWPLPRLAGAVRRARPTAKPVEPARPIPLPDATLALVKTKTDDKHGWVAAGQTMAQAVLQARTLGLSWALFDQVRQRHTREALRHGLGHKGFAQLILHFGRPPSSKTILATPPTTTTATSR
jgi:hypothetical protein